MTYRTETVSFVSLSEIVHHLTPEDQDLITTAVTDSAHTFGTNCISLISVAVFLRLLHSTSLDNDVIIGVCCKFIETGIADCYIDLES